jgi:inorganic pyrophosphatase
MIDHGEADDKIISVLENDYVWGAARDLKDVPPVLVERLQHYFLTYKLVPGQTGPGTCCDRVRTSSCSQGRASSHG